MRQADAPIFIVGYSRSGTSLLRAMLNAHPAIHIAQESAFYQWLQPMRMREARAARAWFEGYARSASFRLLGVDPAPILADTPADLPRAEAGRHLLPRVLGDRAARLGRRRWGDKTPLHSQRLDVIFRDFPEARVIHVARHPAPTVASIGAMPWGTDSAWLSASLYRDVTRAVSAQGDRVLILRLEDLLSDPREALSRALSFLGEPWDDRVLKHERHPTPEDPPLPWLTQAAGALKRPSRQAPREEGELDPALTRIVERVCAQAMQVLGYAPTPMAREPSFGDRLRALVMDSGRALRFLAHAARTAPWTPERLDPVDQLRWLFQLNPSARVPASSREITPALLDALASAPRLADPDRTA